MTSFRRLPVALYLLLMATTWVSCSSRDDSISGDELDKLVALSPAAFAPSFDVDGTSRPFDLGESAQNRKGQCDEAFQILETADGRSADGRTARAENRFRAPRAIDGLYILVMYSYESRIDAQNAATAIGDAISSAAVNDCSNQNAVDGGLTEVPAKETVTVPHRGVSITESYSESGGRTFTSQKYVWSSGNVVVIALLSLSDRAFSAESASDFVQEASRRVDDALGGRMP